MSARELVPRYAWIPLAVTVCFNFVVYIGTRLLMAGRPHYNFTGSLDEMIPFWTGAVIIYLLAYVQWICGFILIARESPAVCRYFLTAEIFAKFLTLLCFLFLPTMMERPEVVGNSFCDMLTRLVYAVDSADNLFPSIHCLESWICFRGSLKLEKVPHWYRPVSFVFTLLVFASTVLLKQHVVVDIAGGVLFVEIGLWMTAHFHLDRFFEKIQCK